MFTTKLINITTLLILALIIFSCNEEPVINSYYDNALKHGKNFRYDSSLYYLLLAEEDFLSTKDESGLMKTYNGLGKVYNEIGLNKEAKKYYAQALKLSQKLNKKKWEMHIANNLGSSEIKYGNYDQASKHLMNALHISENIVKDTNFMVSNYNHIGNFYTELNQYKRAKEYYMKAFKLILNGYSINDYSSITNNLGIVNYHLSNIDSAIYFYKKSIESSFENNDTLNAVFAINNMLLIEDTSVYIEYFKDLAKQNTTPQIEGVIYYSLFSTYYNSNPDLALEYLKKSISKYEESGYYKDLQTSLYEIMPFLIKLNKSKEAEDYLNLLSNTLTETDKNINSKNYELAEKQHQIEIIKKDLEIESEKLKKAKIFVVASVLLSIAIIIMLITIIKLKRTLKEKGLIIDKYSQLMRSKYL